MNFEQWWEANQNSIVHEFTKHYEMCLFDILRHVKAVALEAYESGWGDNDYVSSEDYSRF